MPTMPFGKFKGDDLRDIDSGYLRWLLGNVDLDGWLERAVRRELDLRDDEPPRRGYRDEQSRRSHPPPPPPRPDLRDLVSRWHRSLAKQFHPDAGGSDAKMQAVNVARDSLVELLRGEGLLE